MMFVWKRCLVVMFIFGMANSYKIKHMTSQLKDDESVEEFHQHGDQDKAAFDTIAKTNIALTDIYDQEENETNHIDENDSEEEEEEKEELKKKPKLFESDILIYDYPEGDLETSEAVIGDPVLKRSLRRHQQYLWINRVMPYEFTSDVDGSEHNILEAMANIEAVSCIKFKKRTNEDNWVRFVNKGGCFSGVGRTFWSKGSQDISLTSECQVLVGTIQHELLHALGFWHEQSRTDRDKYIEILWENIAEGQEHNFAKYSRDESTDIDSLYDANSIMHYGRYAFSKNGKPTIQVISDRSKELGQRSGLSSEDQVQLNALYKCQDVDKIYSSWSKWSPCDKDDCTKFRQRFCSNYNAQKCPEATNRGVHTEKATCSKEECHAPINGHWARWSSWTECSASCGEGVRKRARACSAPTPVDGGRSCVGDHLDNQKCEIQPCGLHVDDCLFDHQGMCFWTDQSAFANYKWQRINGKTPTSKTGPDHDHTTAGTTEKKGFYMYAEASSPAQSGNKASLVSKTFQAKAHGCVTFFYSMFGIGTGDMRLYLVRDNGDEDKLWEMSGEQGEGWLVAEVSFSSSTQYKLRFEAERGLNFKSDIGLDDIHFRDTPCSVIEESKLTKVTKHVVAEGKNKVPHINIPSDLVPVCEGVKASLQPLGCYSENHGNRAVGNLLDDHRMGHDGGNVIDWQNYPDTLSKLLCHCLQKAKKSGYSHLALEFYGLCYGGNAPDYGKYGASKECTDSSYQECSAVNTKSVCIGKDQTSYVYKIL